MASSVMEETEMCRLIGKRSQSASCHETREGSEGEKRRVSVLVCCSRSLLSLHPSPAEDRTSGIGGD